MQGFWSCASGGSWEKETERERHRGREGRTERGRQAALLGVQSLLLKPPALALSPLRGATVGTGRPRPPVSPETTRSRRQSAGGGTTLYMQVETECNSASCPSGKCFSLTK